MDEAMKTRLRDFITHTTTLSCVLFRLKSEGKEELGEILRAVLEKCGIPEIYDPIFGVVVELGLNAIKANYRYVTAIDLYRDTIDSREERESIIEALLADQTRFEEFYGHLDIKWLKGKTQAIFSREDRASVIKQKAIEEGRALTEDERAAMRRDLQFANRVYREGLRARLVISFDHDTLIFEAVNDAPITFRSLQQIYSKRAIFKAHLDKGTINDYFLERLDTLEESGFGASLIDMRLAQIGLDPLSSFEVIRLGNKTAATVTIPIETIKRGRTAHA